MSEGDHSLDTEKEPIASRSSNRNIQALLQPAQSGLSENELALNVWEWSELCLCFSACCSVYAAIDP